MIELDYELSGEWGGDESRRDLSTADETALRYNVLLGDIKLRIDGVELGTDFGWVPLVDFAVSLMQIAKELGSSSNKKATFDFTESDAAIRFDRRGRIVEISPSYNPASGSVSFDDFVSVVDAFVARFQTDLIGRFPSLSGNPVLTRLLKKNGNQ
jgi:hypothetical protein